MSAELNIQNKKLELIQWLSTVEDSNIIEKIMDLRKLENKDWWNSISQIEKEYFNYEWNLFNEKNL